MQRFQKIEVLLKLDEGQAPYELLEGEKQYPALSRFFEDIGFFVNAVKQEVIEQ